MIKRYSGLLPGIWLGLLMIIACGQQPVTTGQTSDTSPASQLENAFEDTEYIHLGTQPMLLPTGMIVECMVRDKILLSELRSRGRALMLHPFPKGADINKALSKELLHGGVGGDMPALSAAHSTGAISTAVLKRDNESMISAEPMLTDDMRGKTIGFPYGSTSHFFVLDLITEAGLSVDDVDLVPTAVKDLEPHLLSGDLDLFAAWEPIVANTVNAHPELFISFRKITTAFLYFHPRYFEEYATEVQLLTAAALRALEWLAIERSNMLLAAEWNLATINKMVGGNYSLNAEQLVDIAKLGIFAFSEAQLSESELAEDGLLGDEYIFLQEMGMLSTDRSWSEIRLLFEPALNATAMLQNSSVHIGEFNYLTGREQN